MMVIRVESTETEADRSINSSCSYCIVNKFFIIKERGKKLEVIGEESDEM